MAPGQRPEPTAWVVPRYWVKTPPETLTFRSSMLSELRSTVPEGSVTWK